MSVNVLVGWQTWNVIKKPFKLLTEKRSVVWNFDIDFSDLVRWKNSDDDNWRTREETVYEDRIYYYPQTLLMDDDNYWGSYNPLDLKNFFNNNHYKHWEFDRDNNTYVNPIDYPDDFLVWLENDTIKIRNSRLTVNFMDYKGMEVQETTDYVYYLIPRHRDAYKSRQYVLWRRKKSDNTWEEINIPFMDKDTYNSDYNYWLSIFEKFWRIYLFIVKRWNNRWSSTENKLIYFDETDNNWHDVVWTNWYFTIRSIWEKTDDDYLYIIAHPNNNDNDNAYMYRIDSNNSLVQLYQVPNDNRYSPSGSHFNVKHVIMPDPDDPANPNKNIIIVFWGAYYNSWGNITFLVRDWSNIYTQLLYRLQRSYFSYRILSTNKIEVLRCPLRSWNGYLVNQASSSNDAFQDGEFRDRPLLFTIEVKSAGDPAYYDVKVEVLRKNLWYSSLPNWVYMTKTWRIVWVNRWAVWVSMNLYWKSKDWKQKWVIYLPPNMWTEWQNIPQDENWNLIFVPKMWDGYYRYPFINIIHYDPFSNTIVKQLTIPDEEISFERRIKRDVAMSVPLDVAIRRIIPSWVYYNKKKKRYFIRIRNWRWADYNNDFKWYETEITAISNNVFYKDKNVWSVNGWDYWWGIILDELWNVIDYQLTMATEINWRFDDYQTWFICSDDERWVLYLKYGDSRLFENALEAVNWWKRVCDLYWYDYTWNPPRYRWDYNDNNVFIVNEKYKFTLDVSFNQHLQIRHYDTWEMVVNRIGLAYGSNNVLLFGKQVPEFYCLTDELDYTDKTFKRYILWGKLLEHYWRWILKKIILNNIWHTGYKFNREIKLYIDWNLFFEWLVTDLENLDLSIKYNKSIIIEWHIPQFLGFWQPLSLIVEE